MRKILMFGTMLGVAGTALAFGGMFNHGRKSTTYKGGVDAIGVHINANGGNGTPHITLASCDAYAGTGLVDNETYNGGYAGLASDNQTQCRCPAGTKWNDGACIASEGASCSSWTTNECGTGYYCQFSPTSDTEDPTEGICKDVSICRLYAVEDTEFVASDYGIGCVPDWWTAQAICSSQNMQLIELQDLGCTTELSSICTYSETMHNNLPDEIRTKTPSVDGFAYWVNNVNTKEVAHNEKSMEFDLICK